MLSSEKSSLRLLADTLSARGRAPLAAAWGDGEELSLGEIELLEGYRGGRGGEGVAESAGDAL